MFDNGNGKGDMSALIDIVLSGDIESLEAACRVLNEGLKPEFRRLFLEMAVKLAIVDGRLTISENHMLRFLADLVGESAASLDDIYQAFTGSTLPPPADLSSAHVWASREAEAAGRQRNQSGKSAGSKQQDRRSQSAPRTGMSRLKALAILGLEEEASPDEIRQAYRRLAKVHHPDRFEQLGKDAVRAANATFARVQQAYDYLKRS